MGCTEAASTDLEREHHIVADYMMAVEQMLPLVHKLDTGSQMLSSCMELFVQDMTHSVEVCGARLDNSEWLDFVNRAPSWLGLVNRDHLLLRSHWSSFGTAAKGRGGEKRLDDGYSVQKHAARVGGNPWCGGELLEGLRF